MNKQKNPAVTSRIKSFSKAGHSAPKTLKAASFNLHPFNLQRSTFNLLSVLCNLYSVICNLSSSPSPLQHAKPSATSSTAEHTEPLTDNATPTSYSCACSLSFCSANCFCSYQKASRPICQSYQPAVSRSAAFALSSHQARKALTPFPISSSPQSAHCNFTYFIYVAQT